MAPAAPLGTFDVLCTCTAVAITQFFHRVGKLAVEVWTNQTGFTNCPQAISSKIMTELNYQSKLRTLRFTRHQKAMLEAPST